MVVHIKLGRDGKSNTFDQRSLNVRNVFGPFAILLNRYLEEVPLKSNGETLEPLIENETFIIEIHGLGYGNKIVRDMKKSYRGQAKKNREKDMIQEMMEIEGRSSSISPPDNRESSSGDNSNSSSSSSNSSSENKPPNFLDLKQLMENKQKAVEQKKLRKEEKRRKKQNNNEKKEKQKKKSLPGISIIFYSSFLSSRNIIGTMNNIYLLSFQMIDVSLGLAVHLKRSDENAS